MPMSDKRTSGHQVSSSTSASAADWHARTSAPAPCRTASRTSHVSRSSSTTRTRRPLSGVSSSPAEPSRASCARVSSVATLSGIRTLKVAPFPSPALSASMVPPVELDEVAGDREAEPQAAERPRDGSIGLPEALEEVGEELGLDALARVANRQLEVGIHALEHDVDAPALGCELDRVGKEIPHHLLQPVRIALDQVDPRIQPGLDPDVPGARRRPHGLDRRLDPGREPHRADVEVELPADHPRDLEEVVDEPSRRPRATGEPP